MRLVREAQSKNGSHLHIVKGGKTGFAYRLGRLTGLAAYGILRIIVNPLFLTACVLAFAWLIMHLAGISVEIVRHGEVLVRIR